MSNARVVVDTNVIISAFLKRQSTPWDALARVLNAHVLLFSASTLIELHQRLLNPKFDRYVSRETRLTFLRLLPTLAEHVPVTTTVTACRDPRDNKFLELGIDGHADYIITGDADLLALHPFRSIDIVMPRDFLTRDAGKK